MLPRVSKFLVQVAPSKTHLQDQFSGIGLSVKNSRKHRGRRPSTRYAIAIDPSERILPNDVSAVPTCEKNTNPLSENKSGNVGTSVASKSFTDVIIYARRIATCGINCVKCGRFDSLLARPPARPPASLSSKLSALSVTSICWRQQLNAG